jgi:predicted nucleic acid-binding protein
LALLRGSASLHAPNLIRIEVAAAILRKARLGNLSSSDAEDALEQWFGPVSMTLQLSSDEQNMTWAGVLALSQRLPLDDCLYVALAHRLKVPLVTADRRLVERFSGLGHPIELLGASG